MKVGYARTSTLDQSAGFEAQQRELSTAGCEKVVKEQVSSVGQREQLETALDFIRDGDTGERDAEREEGVVADLCGSVLLAKKGQAPRQCLLR